VPCWPNGVGDAPGAFRASVVVVTIARRAVVEGHAAATAIAPTTRAVTGYE
jgi:hypothetical protein